MDLYDWFKKKKVVEEKPTQEPETPKTPKQENKESFIETEVNNEADVAPKEKQENIIEIDFGGGWYFKLSKDRFFGLLDHYDWEYDKVEAEEESWYFSTHLGDFNVDVDFNENCYFITGNSVESIADLVSSIEYRAEIFTYDSTTKQYSKLEPKGEFVVQQRFSLYDEETDEKFDAYRVEFVDCECPNELQDYYCDISQFFIEGRDSKLAKKTTEYYEKILEDYEGDYSDEAYVYEVSMSLLSKWTLNIEL